MARIRTFIAVELDAKVRARVGDLQEQLARGATEVKWVDSENLHLTLLFLGEVDELDVVSICRAVKKITAGLAPFGIEIFGVGAFPNLRRPKIVWAGIRMGVELLRKLHDAVEAPLLELGCYRREDREYTPHLTLGRLSHEDRSAECGTILAKHAHWDGGDSLVKEVLVMSSELRREGPIYSVMARCPLLGSDAGEEE